MLTVTEIFAAFQIGVFAYVVTCVFTKDKYILSRYDDFLTWLEPKASWLAYPLGYCEICFAGQTGLWAWLYFHVGDYMDSNNDIYVNIWRHALFITFCCISVMIIKAIMKRWK